MPQTLAIARADSYAAYAWPRAFAGTFARNGLVISLIAALSVAGYLAWRRRLTAAAAAAQPA